MQLPLLSTFKPKHLLNLKIKTIMTTNTIQLIKKLEDKAEKIENKIDYLDIMEDKLLEDQNYFEKETTELHREKEFLLIDHNEQYAPDYNRNKVAFIWENMQILNDRISNIIYDLEEIQEEKDKLREIVKNTETEIEELEDTLEE